MSRNCIYAWYDSLGSFGLTLVWCRCVSQVLSATSKQVQETGVSFGDYFWRPVLYTIIGPQNDNLSAISFQKNQIYRLLLLFTLKLQTCNDADVLLFPFMGRAHALAYLYTMFRCITKVFVVSEFRGVTGTNRETTLWMNRYEINDERGPHPIQKSSQALT